MERTDLYRYYRSSSIRDFDYTVKRGDTLYKIAKFFNVSLDDLISANNIENNMIFPNQSLVIPSSNSHGGIYFDEYITKDLDTITSIAAELDVPIELLLKYNDISKLALAENQVVQVPKQYSKYVIQEDDTLERILQKFFMTPEELIYANRHRWLRPGRTINIK